MADLRIGLVGAGSISRAHMRGFVENPHVADVHVADSSQEARD